MHRIKLDVPVIKATLWATPDMLDLWNLLSALKLGMDHGLTVCHERITSQTRTAIFLL